MLRARGDTCCDRCAGAAGGTADAARVARRRLLKDAVFRPQAGLLPEPGGWLGRSETRLALRGAFRLLTRREREVVALRFYSDLTQRGIAERLGLSQAQVSRTLTAAFVKLRSALVEP